MTLLEQLACIRHSASVQTSTTPCEQLEFAILLKHRIQMAQNSGPVLELESAYGHIESLCLERIQLQDSMLAGPTHFVHFFKLTQLDLAHNQITDIRVLRLTELPALTALDLHDNHIKNSLEEIAEVMDGLYALEAIALRQNPAVHSAAQRRQLLLLLDCLDRPRCHLQMVDTPLTIPERFTLLGERAASRMPDNDATRFQVAIFQRSLPRKACEQPELIEELDLSGLEVESLLDLRPFTNLRRLLLRDNRLRSWAQIEQSFPSTLPSLRVLDVRNNEIDHWDGLLALLERFPHLCSFGVAGNPVFTSSSRNELIQLLFSQGGVTLPLWSIDEQEIDPAFLRELHNQTATSSLSKPQIVLIRAV